MTTANVLRERARAMRSDMTPPEQAFWRVVRAHRFRGYGFRRQVPIAGFIVDFCCHEKRLIVEIDGGTHGSDTAVRRDEDRSRRLEEEGYRVIRFWNNDVMLNPDGVFQQLADVLRAMPDAPATQRVE